MAYFTKNQQRNGTNCQFEKYVTTSNYFVLNSLDKGHLNSVCPHYVCDKSENARVCEMTVKRTRLVLLDCNPGRAIQ